MATHNHQNAIRSAKKALAGETTIENLAETFKILGDQTRLKIVLALSKQELCVLDIAAVLGITESAISHQLRLLKTRRTARVSTNVIRRPRLHSSTPAYSPAGNSQPIEKLIDFQAHFFYLISPRNQTTWNGIEVHRCLR